MSEREGMSRLTHHSIIEQPTPEDLEKTIMNDMFYNLSAIQQVNLDNIPRLLTLGLEYLRNDINAIKLELIKISAGTIKSPPSIPDHELLQLQNILIEANQGQLTSLKEYLEREGLDTAEKAVGRIHSSDLHERETGERFQEFGDLLIEMGTRLPRRWPPTRITKRSFES